ncbi:protoporphyrinogen oxidase [Desulfuromusa kysingii]|uniref:Coproporphyrinogen III oxidase n=1 Tax=Desulfuromusa kysingii TaxID=37625 RepID=A0A1H3W463_9BACT|nr:protoporphyrinogen oxidase [Desulfuromusa kysingii]SDZ81905.1 protoporphyrinogen oxidase [Desulfuromusa kysingii]
MTRIAIVGAGISGLATAYAIEQQAKRAEFEVETLVIEKESRTGGKILSVKDNGYLCEWGPNGFLDNKPMTLDLCWQLQIEDQLLRSDDNARKRFIYADKILHQMPENGPAFLKSKLISWPGKFRLAAELVIPKRVPGGDETLAEFGRRRLGEEALNKLISPMVSGIFAGNPETMSLKSCFPRIYELEQDYGGLIKAMLRLAKKKRAEVKAGKAVASAAGPGGVLTSFQGGIQELTDGVAAALSGTVLTGHGVVRIQQKQGGISLRLDDGQEHDVDMVVTAAPAYAVAEMLDELNDKSSKILRQIPYATMNVVCFGYQKERIAFDLNGFGYLIPKAEGCHTLGTLWDSSIFANRAPEGKVLLRSMMGGAANMTAIEFSEDEVKARTMSDLKQIMGINCEPEFIKIFRHRHAIPQYISGHAQRLLELESSLQDSPDLILTGNAFYGVGLNDCVNAANKAAEKVVARLQARVN